jgi:hypothetical protein
VAASRGIDRARVDELDGEVTGLEVVSGVLTKHGAHGGHGDVQGRRRVFVQRLYEVGSVLGCQQGGAQALGVDGGGVIEE